jgi:hypothetical protein
VRTRALILLALLSLPSEVIAQGIRPPRGGRTPTPLGPTNLPPEIPAVARALAYKRSRWSGEGYAIISSIQVPSIGSGATRYTTYGTGTLAGYQITDRFSATMDLTISPLGGPATTATAEVGTRYRPLALDAKFRPFLDVRAGYVRMYDRFSTPEDPSITGSGPRLQIGEESRYSHGLGGIAGAGVEFSLTPSLALTNELSAMRNRMTVYRTTGSATIPSAASNYWMTSLRYTLGLRYNAARALHLAQKPAQ